MDDDASGCLYRAVAVLRQVHQASGISLGWKDLGASTQFWSLILVITGSWGVMPRLLSGVDLQDN